MEKTFDWDVKTYLRVQTSFVSWTYNLHDRYNIYTVYLYKSNAFIHLKMLFSRNSNIFSLVTFTLVTKKVKH